MRKSAGFIPLVALLLAGCGDDRQSRAERAQAVLGNTLEVQVVAARDVERLTEATGLAGGAQPTNQLEMDQLAARTSVSSTRIHAAESGPQQSLMIPDTFFHADEGGRDNSRYMPSSFMHYDVPGPDNSRYLRDNLYHVDFDGPDSSRLVPDEWEHIADTGPSQSRMLPWDYEHKGWGQNASLYVHPDDLDAFEARDFAQDPDWSEFGTDEERQRRIERGEIIELDNPERDDILTEDDEWDDVPPWDEEEDDDGPPRRP